MAKTSHSSHQNSRFSSSNRFRNPRNLHVINTDMSTVERSVTTVPSGTSVQEKKYTPQNQNFFKYNKYKEGLKKKYASLLKGKKKEKHKINKQKNVQHRTSHHNVNSNPYQWYNPNYKASQLKEQKTMESADEISETPFDDGDFEEVETISEDESAKNTESHAVPVGYRKYKPTYLRYKGPMFFKPKFYIIPSHRIRMGCFLTNSNEEVVVSEDEYEAEGEVAKSNSDIVEECYIEDVEEGEKEYDDEVNVDCTDNSDEKRAEGVQLDLSPEVLPRMYKCSIENNIFTSDFYQGKAVIQDNLDSWSSHLIGLEYLVEIRKESDNSAEGYNCILCEEDLRGNDVCAESVIGHIIKYKHSVKYLVYLIIIDG